MLRTELNLETFRLADLAKTIALAVLLTACVLTSSLAWEQGQKTLASPEGAANAYQKDLGKKTEALGNAMKEYNLDSTWPKAEESPGPGAY